MARRRACRTALASVAVSLASAAALSGCGSSSPDAHATIVVAHPTSLSDSVDPVSITGLSSGQTVTLSASTTADGERFTSTDAYRIGAGGTVSLTTQAPEGGGSYSGVQAMGFLWSMRPPAADQIEFYSDETLAPQPVALTAYVDHHQVASARMTRVTQAPGVTDTSLRPSHGGLYAQLFRPPSYSGNRPAVLIFGGSEGGDSVETTGALLASHGIPTMTLAYFDEPGLPQLLDRIPLEYFAAAVRRLDAVPGVDPHQITVSGGSYGTEAALLLAAHYPGLVDRVIAASPSNVVSPGCYGHRACSPFSLDGQPLPYQRVFGPRVVEPADAIPVQDITAHLMLICGVADETWPSCPMTDAMVTRLESDHRSQPMVLRSVDGGHFVDALLPDVALHEAAASGRYAQSNAVARTALWPKVLAFVGADSRG